MQVKIYNPHGEVQSVFIELTQLCLNIYVNFKNKHPNYYWVYGPGNLELCVEEFDKVLFIAENSIEKEFLQCINFDLMNKDQLWSIFIKDVIYKNGNNIENNEFIKDNQIYQQLV